MTAFEKHWNFKNSHSSCQGSGIFFSDEHSSCPLKPPKHNLFLILITLWISTDRMSYWFLKTDAMQLTFHSLLSKVGVCVRVTQQLLQHVEAVTVTQSQTGGILFLNGTNDIQFLCRYPACLGGCGATTSQTEGERRGPHAGETLPAKDCPAEPPVPSYTQLTASSAEAPGEGTARD